MKNHIFFKIALVTFFISLNTVAQTINVMSFNIRYDNPNDGENSWKNRKESVTNLIEYYHPDFLGIQEALQNQLLDIQNKVSNYSLIGEGRDGGREGEFSPILYDTTKFDLLKTETFWLSESPYTPSVGWDAMLNRIRTYGLFEDKKTHVKIHVFNTHFDHKGTKAQKMSAKLILKKIKKATSKKSKIIVLGDLNCEPNSKPIQFFKTQLIDSAEKNNRYGPKGTLSGFNRNTIVTKKIDYIFIKNFEVNKYRHIDDKKENGNRISDHLPVLITIE